MTRTRWGARRACGVLVLAIACGDSHGTGAIEGPPAEELLIMQQMPCSSAQPTDPAPMTCTFVYFDDRALKAACVVPDADSFDDYVEYRFDNQGQVAIDPQTGMPIAMNERGTVPYPGSEQCEADGIVTGPNGDTYYPSKFCRVPCDGESAGSGAP